MNIPQVAEKIVEAVKKAPKIQGSYMYFGEPHLYSTTDWDALELAIQEILNTQRISTESEG